MWHKVSDTLLPVMVRVEIKRPNGSTEFGMFKSDFSFVTDSFVTLGINPKWLWRIPLND